MRYRFSFNGFGRHKWIRRCPQTAAYQIEPAACSGALSVAEALEFKETNCHVGEEKFDGLRYLLQVYPCDDNESYMTSRRVSVITKLFVEKQAKTLVPLNPHGIDRKLVSVKAFPFKAALKGCVFDGELFSKGLSSDAQHDMLHGRAEYHVFDVLFANGKFVGHLPLYKRIAIRDSLAKHFPHWMKLVRNTRNIQWLIKEVLKRKGEGIIIKDLSAPYGEGWEKVKTEITEDVLICGYEDTNSAAYKKKGWIGSIKIAQYIPIGIFSKWRNNKDAPKYVVLKERPLKGHVLVEMGSAAGISNKLRNQISKSKNRFLWKQIEITAQLRLESGYFRSPRFKRFREDINQRDCRMKGKNV